MAPLLQSLFARREFDPGAPAHAFAEEWSNPSNYAFTILLLLGGDLINRALAQLAGGMITPVAFSFGMLKLFSLNRLYLLLFIIVYYLRGLLILSQRLGLLCDYVCLFSARGI
jgi:hypothetical protein